MTAENKRLHLQIIQGVVDRMANTSFVIKGWSVTLVAAVLALTVDTTSEPRTAAIALVPVVVFWILDGYYLCQERLFRALYDSVREKPEAQVDFSMQTASFKGGSRTWLASSFSATLLVFNVALIATTIGVILFVHSAS